jgi:hypothetical protein
MSRLFGGTMFGGARDLYATFGYKREPRFDDFLFKYMRQDIARTIVNAPCDAIWSDPPSIQADPTFNLAWQQLLANHNIWHVLNNADRLAGIGAFSIVLLGFDDAKPLSQPVQPIVSGATKKGRALLYMQAYMQGSVRISSYVTNSSDPRFGLPLMYHVKPSSQDFVTATAMASGQSGSGTGAAPMAGGSSVAPTLGAFDVHWSRVIHIADNTLENGVYGMSRLYACYNLLDDMLKVAGGSAETYWLTANRGMQADVDKEMELDPADAANLEKEIDEYQHDLRRVIRTRGVTMKDLGSQVANPTGPFEVLLSLLAAATRIPKRILIGSEAGQLASTQDRANWATLIGERQVGYAAPVIVLPLIARLVYAGVLPPANDFIVTWPDAFKLSPLERGQTSAQMARSAANLQKMISDPIGSVQVTEVTTTFIATAAPTVAPPPSSPSSPAIVANATETVAGTGSEAQVRPAPQGSVVTTRVWIEGGVPILSMEEARNVIGFGKTMPVFDSPQDTLDKTKTIDP